MKGDFTRSTFQRQKHYTSVRMQQGRLQLDSDWNEQADIQNHLRQAQVVDMIGSDSGAPSVNPVTGKPTRNSFRIGLVSLDPPPSDQSSDETSGETSGETSRERSEETDANDLVIIPGHFYTNGVLCEFESGTPFEAQIKDLGARQVIVPSLLVDGHKLQVNQWLEVVSDSDSDTVANSNSDDPIFLQGLQIVSIDEKRRELTLRGELSSLVGNQTTVKLRRLMTYRTQPDYPLPDRASLSSGSYLAYLDVWERHITVIDDEEIRETALNVPDTTTRTKTVWQLKLMALEQPTEVQASAGAEVAETASTPQSQWTTYVDNRQSRQSRMNACARLCSNGQNGGALRSLENQLYRVEIHQPGKTPTESETPSSGAETASAKQENAIATFKWSRNNGSTASAIERIENNVIRIRKTSEDAWGSSVPGQWLEITSEDNELRNEPGVMVPLARATDTKIEFDESRIINGPIPTNAKTVRRWDYTTDQAPQGAIPVQTTWVDLEDGIRVTFYPESSYETGDYWMIPARSGPGDIEWPTDQAVPNPQPTAQPRRGITHEYALLATVDVVAQQRFTDLQDERLVFPALIDCLSRRGGTIEGDLEVQGNLSVTQRPDEDGAGPIIGKVSIGLEEAEARLHVQAAEGLSDPIVRVDDSGGTPQFTILENGNVGIGTPDPQTQLEVNGKTRTQDLEVIGGFASNLFRGQTFEIVKNPTSNAPERYGLIRVSENESPKHVELAVDAATTFAFASGKVGIGSAVLASQFGVLGNAAIGSAGYLNSGQIPANGLVVEGTVGIGTSTPDSQFKLDIAGGVKASGNTVLATTDASQVRIGAVNSPDSDVKLHVKGNVKVEGDIEGTNLTFQSNVIFSQGNQDLKLRTNNTDRIIIASTGNVGIGAAPINDVKLLVEGKLQANGEIQGDRFTFSSGIINSPDDTNLTLRTGSDDRLTIAHQTGNVGIGTPPINDVKLVVDGNLQANGEIQGDRFTFSSGIINSPDDTDLTLQTGSDARLSISHQTGNVGIGISPVNGAKLVVDGNLQANGEIQGNQLLLSNGIINSDDDTDLTLSASEQLGLVVSKTNGNVSVGANSVPDDASAAKLYINGPIYIEGEAFSRQSQSEEFVQLSSQTLKQEIAQLSSQEVAELLEQLRPVKFIYRDDTRQNLRAGFLAEEAPDLLTSQDKQGIRILDVVAVLTRSLKDQQTQISDLVKVIQEQNKEITALKNKVSEAEQQPVSRAISLDVPNSNPSVSQFNTFSPLNLYAGETHLVQASQDSPPEANMSFSEMPLPDPVRLPRTPVGTKRRPGWTRWPLIRQIRKFFYWVSNRLLHRQTRRRLQRTRFH